MPFTNDDYLPSLEELEVEEINMTSAPLRAGAVHFGKYCDEQSKEFMLCATEEKDPRKCIKEGKEVTRCALDFFRKVKAHCAQEFTDYWKCVDVSGMAMNVTRCKPTQALFDKCVLEKLAIERPPPGYFARVRVHHTQRPKPHVDVWLPEPLPDPAVPTEEDYNKEKFRPGYVWVPPGPSGPQK